ncbi:Hypothetical_protein [Hexamita inflata]|uniref:Hypothetical_protein n=1 Tax=Hexamita inflata TaxID=28002 RepID=A0AA86RB88_9EUKA|nr:Hypothetical protein HINF_LOCUS61865 [Hexamita inflata]
MAHIIHPDKLERTLAKQEEIQMELRMPNKTTNILSQLQNVQIAFQRKATTQNRKQDNQFTRQSMTIFPGLSLDQMRNNANTITRNSPTQPKAVINKKIQRIQITFQKRTQKVSKQNRQFMALLPKVIILTKQETTPIQQHAVINKRSPKYTSLVWKQTKIL